MQLGELTFLLRRFHLHWILQAIAAILVISGVVLGHYFAVVTDLQKAHRVIGIVAVSLLGVQVSDCFIIPKHLTLSTCLLVSSNPWLEDNPQQD